MKSLYFLFSDPFLLTHNLGQGVDDRMAVFIKTCFCKGRNVFGNPPDMLPPYYKEWHDYFFDRKRLTEGNLPTGRGCRLCGKIGHKIKECPVKMERKNRQRRHRNQKDTDRDANEKTQRLQAQKDAERNALERLQRLRFRKESEQNEQLKHASLRNSNQLSGNQINNAAVRGIIPIKNINQSTEGDRRNHKPNKLDDRNQNQQHLPHYSKQLQSQAQQNVQIPLNRSVPQYNRPSVPPFGFGHPFSQPNCQIGSPIVRFPLPDALNIRNPKHLSYNQPHSTLQSSQTLASPTSPPGKYNTSSHNNSSKQIIHKR